MNNNYERNILVNKSCNSKKSYKINKNYKNINSYMRNSCKSNKYCKRNMRSNNYYCNWESVVVKSC